MNGRHFPAMARALPVALLLVPFGVARATPPAAPTDLIATAPAVGEIALTWTDNAGDEIGFRVQFREPPETAWGTVSTHQANTDDVALSAVPSLYGHTLEFRVVAFNAGGEGSPSAPAGVTLLDGIISGETTIVRPGGPVNYQIAASDSGGGGIASYAADGLPDGVTVNPGTGAIAGTPTEDGFFDVVLTVTYNDGALPPVTGHLLLRIPPVPAPPVGHGRPLILHLGAPPFVLLLSESEAFTDPDTRVAVRVATPQGQITVSLYDRAAAGPVENFLAYVDADAYTDNVFHRSVNAASSDIIQSGGFTPNGAAMNSVPTNPPIVHAPGIANDRGTLALARTPVPNSATSGWYFNALDSPGLDNLAGGGYAVFGRATANSLATIDAIFAFPTGTHAVAVNGNPPTNFKNFPTLDGAAPNGTNFVLVDGIDRVPALEFEIVSSPPAAIATTTLDGESLTLAPVAPGPGLLRIRARDIDGNEATADFPVLVLENFDHWTAGLPNLAPDADDDADGIPLLLEYALVGDPESPDAGAILPVGVAHDGRLALRFASQIATSDLIYSVEQSDDLTLWTEVWRSGVPPQDPPVAMVVPMADKLLVTVTPPPDGDGDEGHGYLRLRVELAAPAQ